FGRGAQREDEQDGPDQEGDGDYYASRPGTQHECSVPGGRKKTYFGPGRQLFQSLGFLSRSGVRSGSPADGGSRFLLWTGSDFPLRATADPVPGGRLLELSFRWVPSRTQLPVGAPTARSEPARFRFPVRAVTARAELSRAHLEGSLFRSSLPVSSGSSPLTSRGSG